MSSDVPTKTEYAHIVHTAGVVNGGARIEGHRIRVRDIVAARDVGGLTPEEIAASVYPELTLAQVYAALAYYHANRDEIEAAIALDAQKAATLAGRHTSSGTKG